MPRPRQALVLQWCVPLLATFARAGADDAAAPTAQAIADFEKTVRPVLETHCFDCHADGAKKGNIAFDDAASTHDLVARTDLWLSVLKNVRAGLMPPAKKERLTAEEATALDQWILRGAFGLDPARPDPGRVTLRRLNRVEYRNTVRDLTGHDFRTDEEFPADDTGYGFDTIADVLTTSPLLLEKYLQAAETIVDEAVPKVSRVLPVQSIPGGRFRGQGEDGGRNSGATLSFYDAVDISTKVQAPTEGDYRLTVDGRVRGSFDFDPGRVDAAFFVDGEERWRQELKWKDGQPVDIAVTARWTPGEHELRLTLKPLVDRDQKPRDRGEGQTFVNLRLDSARVEGPLDPRHWKTPPNYARFFPRAEPPEDAEARHAYATEIIRAFASKAFRRPVDDATLQRLLAIRQNEASLPGATFETSVARAFTAVLASPRFIFRQEETLPATSPDEAPLLDEFALASRLSYFLWSTMPDDELLALAQRGELRAQLPAQLQRLLRDERSREFVSNFAGQWLQTRDVESVSIDARTVLARDAGGERDLRQRFEQRRRLGAELEQAEKDGDAPRAEALRRQLAELRGRPGQRRVEFSADLRRSMRREAEMVFHRIIREDLSVLQLIDSNWTFLNELLASHYGVPGVSGGEMRLVELPPDSPRGGVLTMGATLAVTSNPTRTSPVKRGLFILDNVLGTPPPPPPPDVPALEDAARRGADGREPTLRESLALHREKPLCASCHDRMDPLGLAFENFNAIGMVRDKERGQPIAQEPGRLVTGETFADVRELKRVLITARRTDVFRCLAEKVLTYALGRGPQPCDVPALDEIVTRMQREDGKFSALLAGIVESAPFQKRRPEPKRP